MAWPKRIRNGAGGATWYFDGVGAPSQIFGNSGINAIMDILDEPAAQVLTTQDFADLKAFFDARG